MLPGAVVRGLRNPFRSVPRAALIIVLLALLTGVCALMVQAALASRDQIARLETRIQTLIELREAGAFGTGGFGGDKPVGEEHFSTDTLAKVKQSQHTVHLARVDEYVYSPQIDPTRPNAYAMVIGLHPGAALRAIGEVDYEHTRVVAGRGLRPEDSGTRVAVVGRVYALQRLGVAQVSDEALRGRELALNGRRFDVIGVYTTGNDFGDNHVFVPIEAFRAVYRPGKKLSKIFVTVDSVANVERVVADFKTALPEADVVTTPEAVSTARTTLGSLAVASTYGAVLLFALGAVLVVFVMILSTHERIREIGTLKAIGASNAEVAIQFLAEAVALSGLGAVGAIVVAALSARVFQRAFAVPVAVDAHVFLIILVGAVTFAALGSFYPVVRGARLSPVEAMRNT